MCLEQHNMMTMSDVGLIANVGATGNKGDIDLIKNFVTTYIRKLSCIILLTVTWELPITPTHTCLPPLPLKPIFKIKGLKNSPKRTIPLGSIPSVSRMKFSQ